MTAISKLKILALLFAVVLFYGAMIFIPTGTFYWPDAWAYLLTQMGIMGLIASWLAKHNPNLLKERMRISGKNVKGWDRIIQALFIVLCVAFFAVVAFDAVIHHWSSVPLWAKAVGYLGFFAIMSVMFWTMRVNSFLARTAKIQKDRGQKVVTTGPYAYVRHPMYAAFIWYLPSISLMLGSLYGLAMAAVFDVVIITRTYLEDKMLQKELEGYKEYTKKVRYRLWPGIW